MARQRLRAALSPIQLGAGDIHPADCVARWGGMAQGSDRRIPVRRMAWMLRRSAFLCMAATMLSIVVVLAEDGGVKAGEKADAAPITFDTLAGNLPGVVLARSTPYLVVGDIFVPRGTTVRIQAGTVFLFKNFTGLHVLGRLEAKGAKEEPIVFTSEHDRDYNPVEGPDAAPYDWNGVRIHADAVGSSLRYCAVMYSVDGIISDTRFIRIDPCLFVQNGNENLTIEGEVHEVRDQYYRYAISVDDPSVVGVPRDILRDPLARRRSILRYGGLALCAGGCVMGILYSAGYGESRDELRSLSGVDRQNLAANSSGDWERARDKVDGSRGGMLVGWGLLTVGALGFAWTFTF
ncbi:MAG: hypothetical protein GF344_14190 [Chitinivibrionales bacterium]|nr:hypothetical protein [Chitinivibrionales bacterium]MBD3357877.1 hypothetical protein [Chitinivibrionales bacterium]